jgi:tetratricopeptide (TPR) repeat protein
MANIDIPRGKQAAQAWQQLDRRMRREVIRRARRGIGHPDPSVAAIAVGYAQRTLHAPLWRQVVAVASGLAAGMLAGWLLSGLPSDSCLPRWWFWLGLPLTCTPATLAVSRVQARQLERANLETLAGALEAQGELPAARQLHEQALEVSRRTLGPEHPNTLTSMSNLARVLEAQGAQQQAEEIRQQLRAAQQRRWILDGDATSFIAIVVAAAHGGDDAQAALSRP